MKIEFVSYEQALELKQLGFDEGCLAVYRGGSLYGSGTSVSRYYEDGDWELEKNSSYGGDIKQWVAAPLKQQVLRWFREKYNIIGLIEGGFDMTNIFTYCIWEGFKDKIYDDYYGTYEEAEDVLINLLIDKVKNK